MTITNLNLFQSLHQSQINHSQIKLIKNPKTLLNQNQQKRRIHQIQQLNQNQHNHQNHLFQQLN